jgi:hypothetical protein
MMQITLSHLHFETVDYPQIESFPRAELPGCSGKKGGTVEGTVSFLASEVALIKVFVQSRYHHAVTGLEARVLDLS